MIPAATPYRPMNTLVFVLGIVLVIGTVFPLAFLYIEDHVTLRILMDEFWMTPLRLIFITLMIYGVIMLGNRLSGRHQNHWLRHTLQLIIIIPAMYGILYGFLVWVDFPLHCPDCIPDGGNYQQRRYYGLYFFGTLFLYTFISGLNFYKMAEQKAAEAEQLQEQCAGVCLQALKTQVNPHFLFNSLSVLSELVKQDAQRSEQFIHHLGKAYRYILEQKEMELVTVQEELDFLDAYFFLLQIRFGNKIRLEKSVEP
ncbi:MAG TPA: histidine kinase, partial [Phnomibacter sp.]|nr:histidine kinase [Phnomibacter sp.]